MKPTVLVIDDESIVRRLVAHTLKTLNVEVLAAASAAEALHVAGEQTVDLILCDINLPDIDGFALMARLKAMPRLGHVPLIAFTARNHSEDEAQALAVGVSGFLYKPFSTQELREMVADHLTPS